jgi:ligand-binding SRPBCC domain-containing protein
MHVFLHFAVAQPPAVVAAGFTRELFMALAPPFPAFHLLRYDGAKTGDTVAIELQAGPKRWRWTSLITDHGVLPDGTHFFVDEGQLLPAPLRQWRHRHLIQPAPSGGSVIVEDITFSTGRRWLDYLIWPAMWAQFKLRGPVYRRWFK